MRLVGVFVSVVYLHAVSSPVENGEQVVLQELLRDSPADVVALATRVTACRDWTAEVTDEASDKRAEHMAATLRCDDLAEDAVALRLKYIESERTVRSIDLLRALVP